LGIIGTLFLVVFAIAAILIITLVLLQDEQGEGFGGLFGGGGTPFGAVGGSILVKATSILGLLFMLSSLAVAIAYKSSDTDNVIGESRAASGTRQDWFLEQPAQPEEP